MNIFDVLLFDLISLPVYPPFFLSLIFQKIQSRPQKKLSFVPGGDTLGNLISDFTAADHRGEEGAANIPQSESLSGMREISPDETTYDRRGPLTIPTNAAQPLLDNAHLLHHKNDEEVVVVDEPPQRDIDELLGYDERKFR